MLLVRLLTTGAACVPAGRATVLGEEISSCTGGTVWLRALLSSCYTEVQYNGCISTLLHALTCLNGSKITWMLGLGSDLQAESVFVLEGTAKP